MKKTRNGVSWVEAGRRAGEKSIEKKLKRVEKYNLDPLLCEFCKEPILYDKRRNRFCDHSCAAKYNNRLTDRHKPGNRYSKKPCAFCGRITDNVKCCNNKCYSEYIKERRRKRIKQNDSLIDNRKDKWYLIEIRGHKCEVCSTEEWMNKPIPLDTHHKDGDSDNNYLDNLLLICPNCHRQTKNHGSKNKTNSKRKQYRKKRYDKGLSY